MAPHGVPDLAAEFLPRVRQRHDGMTEGAGDEAAFGFVFADFKDDLVQGFTLSRAGAEKEVRFASLSGRGRRGRAAGE